MQSINLPNALAYVRSLKNEQLDGLYFACDAKMKELGLSRDSSVAEKHPPVTLDFQPTGNLKSLTDAIANAEAPTLSKATQTRTQRDAITKQWKELQDSIVAIHWVIRAQMRTEKYSPRPVLTQDDVDAAKSREVKAQGRANARASASHAEREQAKAARESAAIEDRMLRAAAEAQAEAEQAISPQPVHDGSSPRRRRRRGGN